MSRSDSQSNDSPSSWEPLVDEFDRLWQAALKGKSARPRLNELLARVPENARAQLLGLLAPIERECRLQSNESLQPETDYPELSAELRQQLAQLWAAPLEAATLPPQKPGAAAAPSAASRTATSQTIGPYKLLQKLGEGGMGEVWMAEQSEPVRRRVALKLIKAGLDNKQVLARFEAERQALAMMDHQNIARVLDAGATPEGAPYFVMELVQGIPFNQYCDQHKLSINQRLALFLPVCAAVQHAHQKGIIHRDLKPSNVLVCLYDGQPVPKVIDFGLAKALQATTKLTDKTMFTEFGQVVGTLQYMSPEQAEMNQLDIDTRTDIYSLGVMLYELLTGSTPIDQDTMRRQAILQVLEAIRVEEPPRPSARLSSATQEAASGISQQRQIDPSKLKNLLRGELDWIVMKALEKDRTRRYETASSFGDDIQRYLSGDVVTARPPSLGYRVRKFVRRNRVGVLAASLVLLALLAGIGGTTWGLFRALSAERLASDRLVEATEARNRESKQRLEAENQREAAELARKDAEQAKAKAEAETAAKEQALVEETRQRQYTEAVTEFVERDFLALTSVEGQANLFEDTSARELGKDTTLSELLDRAAEKLRQRENLAPEIEARLCSVVGNSYRANGDAAKGLPFLERALELNRDLLGTDHPDTLSSMGSLSVGYLDAGQLDDALPLLEQNLELRKASLGPDHPHTLSTMNCLAAGFQSAGQLEKAIPVWEQTLELMATKLGPDNLETLVCMNNLASGYEKAGRLDKALPLFERALNLMKAKLGTDHPKTIASMHNLAGCYDAAGQTKMALSLSEKSLELSQLKLGLEHPLTLSCMNRLAMCYSANGRPDKAIQLWQQTLELQKAKLGPDHPSTLLSLHNLAVGYESVGQLKKALPLYEQVYDLRKSRLGPEHPNTIVTLGMLASCYKDDKQLDKALPLLEQTLQLARTNFGPEHRDTLKYMNRLAEGYQVSGQPEKAIPLLEQTFKSASATLGPTHRETLTSINGLAYCYWQLGEPHKSVPLFERMVKASEKLSGRDHPATQQAIANLGVNYKNAGRIEEAIPLLEEVVSNSRRIPELLGMKIELRDAYLKGKRLENFSAIAAQELNQARATLPADSTELASVLVSLAKDFLTLGDNQQAEKLLEETFTIRKQVAPDLWNTFNVQSLLGAAKLAKALGLASEDEAGVKAKLLAEAEPLLVQGYEGMKQRESTIPPQGNRAIPEALDRLVELYTALEKPDEVTKYRDLRNQFPAPTVTEKRSGN